MQRWSVLSKLFLFTSTIFFRTLFILENSQQKNIKERKPCTTCFYMVTQKTLQQFHTLVLNFYRHVNSNNNSNNKNNEEKSPATIVQILNDLDEIDAPIKNVPDQVKYLHFYVERHSTFCTFIQAEILKLWNPYSKSLISLLQDVNV